MSGLSKLFSLHYPISHPEKPNRRFLISEAAIATEDSDSVRDGSVR
jgi:hypothetical protein